MRVVVLEPSGRDKRARVRVSLAAGRAAGAEAAGETARRESTAAALAALRPLRDAVEVDPLAAADHLESVLRREGLRVVRATDAQAAAQAIADVAVDSATASPTILSNNSAVIKEMRAALEARGIRLLSGYPGRSLPASQPVITRGWQLPREPAAQAEATFAEHLPRIDLGAAAPTVQDGSGVGSGSDIDSGPSGLAARSDVTALLGVSAAGADGSLVWVQHHENISYALRHAGRLILVVPVDKVLAEEGAARLQAEVTAAHGWAPRLLDPIDPDAGAAAEEFWRLAGDHHGMADITVVVLDNGRAGLVDGHYASLLRCISCRACRTDCPTQRWFGGHLNMSPVEYVRFFLLGLHDDLGLCVGCGNCTRSCPVDIEIPELIARLRDERGLARYSRDFFTMNPELIGRWGQTVLAGSPGGRRAGVLAEAVAGIHRDAHLPPYAPQDFYSYIADHSPLRSERRVVFFSGCFVNYHDLQQGIATVRLLERAGFAVDVPHHHCCDIPKLQGGAWSHARGNAEENVRVLAQASRGAEAIVTGCPSCARALTEFYPELLGEQAAWLPGAVVELFHLLREIGFDPAIRGEVPTPDAEVGSRLLGATTTVGGDGVTATGVGRALLYHSPCHYPGVDPERSLLWLLERAGAVVTEVDRGCCGMSGSFGFRARYHELSQQIGADIFARVGECAGMQLITNCGACRLQLEQGTGRHVPHAAVVLEEMLTKEEQR